MENYDRNSHFKNFKQDTCSWSNLLTVVASTIVGIWVSPVLAADIRVQEEKIKDVSSFIFSGADYWDYSLQPKSDSSWRLVLPYIHPNDKQKLIDRASGDLIANITVTPIPGTSQNEVIFELNRKADIDAFPYLTSSPSRLIVDFFIKEEETTKKTKAAGQSKKNQTAKKPKKKKMTKHKKGPSKKIKISRAPAADYIISEGDSANLSNLTQGIFDASDPNYERFHIYDHQLSSEGKWRAKHEFFVPFPMLRSDTTGLEPLLNIPVEYHIDPKPGDDNKYARLILKLFKKGKWGLFFKTLKFHRNNFRDSSYSPMLDYLEADAYYSLWQKEKKRIFLEEALKRYMVLSETEGNPLLSERTFLRVLSAKLDVKDYVKVLSLSERFLNLWPNSDNKDHVRILKARALQGLKNYKASQRIFDDLISNTQPPIQAAAKFWKGNLEFATENYSQAIQTFGEALEQHKDQASTYPHALFNQAEAFFWENKYLQSAETFRKFIQLFPNHSYVAYAATRLGEILKVVAKDDQRAKKAFLEAEFRFPKAEGTTVAKLRLLEERMSGMKKEELKQITEGLHKKIQKSTIPMIEEFANLMIADGYFARSEFNTSLKRLLRYVQSHPNSKATPVFKERIVRSIADLINHQLKDNDILSAMKTYGRYADTWLKNHQRPDISFNIAKSFEIAGVYKKASELYLQLTNQLYALGHNQQRILLNNLPVELSTDSLNLRLAATSFEQKQPDLTIRYLNDIVRPEDLSPEQKVERLGLIAAVAIQQKKTALAKHFLKKLVSEYKSMPINAARPILQLARVYKDEKKWDEAMTWVKHILDIHSKTNVLPDKLHFEALKLRADTLVAQGKTKQAIQSLQDLLQKYKDSEFDLRATRYQLGELHLKDDNLEEAQEVWQPFLTQKNNDLWTRLAKEQLASKKWKNNYESYLDRSPAAQTGQGG